MQNVLKTAEEKMKKSINVLDSDYKAIRAGRANPAVLDKIVVDYYGAETPINQMAAISVSEARVLVVQPWDASMLKEIEKAIQASDLGINPTNDGKVLRITFPQLTGKVAIRSIRRDAMEKFKAMKKNSEITEDDLKDCEKKVQNLTDKYCDEVDALSKKKEKEIMEI